MAKKVSKRKQRQADKSNGISKPRKAGRKPRTPKGRKRNPKRTKKGDIDSGSTLQMGAEENTKKSTSDILDDVQGYAEKASSIAGTVGAGIGSVKDVVDHVKQGRASGGGGGADDSTGDAPAGKDAGKDADEKPDFMAQLKKYWYIPVAVLVGGVIIYFVSKGGKK
jgi:hypothetical protein